MTALIDILLVTYDSPQYLLPCIQSILDAPSAVGLKRIIVINNGHSSLEASIPKSPEIVFLQMEKNLGWEGGLKKGLEFSKAPFVMFMNDDTFVPPSNGYWLNKLLRHFKHEEVGAVGPSSNCVMGAQNIFSGDPHEVSRSSFLIGFCALFRREALDKVGGVDDTLPHHGDDIDLSIRLRKSGYELLIDRTVFVYHHGFKTGQREHGSYWNSGEMQEKTNHYLIRKHSLTDFWKTISGQLLPSLYEKSESDSEGQVVRKYVSGEKVLELGCGGQKTISHSIGIDLIASEEVVGSTLSKSVADVTGNVEEELPFQEGEFDTLIARHILEHCKDTLKTLENWNKALKHGGQLIIAVPDERRGPSIPMNIEHCHVFTPESLKRLTGAVGLKEVAVEDGGNAISFVGVYSKNGVH